MCSWNHTSLKVFYHALGLFYICYAAYYSNNLKISMDAIHYIPIHYNVWQTAFAFHQRLTDPLLQSIILISVTRK